MPNRKRYRRKPGQFVTAVRLALDTAGFTYRKWGEEQQCKAGDWLVDNGSEVYTVDAAVFARTYRRLGPGVYAKTTPIYAERAETGGRVRTKEGLSEYRAGDYLVANDAEGDDAYCIGKDRFEALYEPDE